MIDRFGFGVANCFARDDAKPCLTHRPQSSFFTVVDPNRCYFLPSIKTRPPTQIIASSSFLTSTLLATPMRVSRLSSPPLLKPSLRGPLRGGYPWPGDDLQDGTDLATYTQQWCISCKRKPL